MTATVPSVLLSRRCRPTSHRAATSFLVLGRKTRITFGRNAGRPYHVHHAAHEAEQQKYDQPPWRDPEHAVKGPADGSTDDDPGHEFAGESKSACITRRIGSRWTTA